MPIELPEWFMMALVGCCVQTGLSELILRRCDSTRCYRWVPHNRQKLCDNIVTLVIIGFRSTDGVSGSLTLPHILTPELFTSLPTREGSADLYGLARERQA